mmetsp:Transcript_43591/g.72418  ORF Transcript_43591/g.72418 Transcript_43591/m.72418 type:complete len:194 (+) Transcript_43591:3-584(+)
MPSFEGFRRSHRGATTSLKPHEIVHTMCPLCASRCIHATTMHARCSRSCIVCTRMGFEFEALSNFVGAWLVGFLDVGAGSIFESLCGLLRAHIRFCLEMVGNVVVSTAICNFAHQMSVDFHHLASLFLAMEFDILDLVRLQSCPFWLCEDGFTKFHAKFCRQHHRFRLPSLLRSSHHCTALELAFKSETRTHL